MYSLNILSLCSKQRFCLFACITLNSLYKADIIIRAKAEKSKRPIGVPNVEVKKLKTCKAVMTGMSIIIKGNITMTQIIPKGHTAEIKTTSLYTIYYNLNL